MLAGAGMILGTRGPYYAWNPSDLGTNVVLINSNRTAYNSSSSGVARSARGIQGHVSGKKYFEATERLADQALIGLAGLSLANTATFKAAGAAMFDNTNDSLYNGLSTIVTTAPGSSGILQFCWDLDAKLAWVRRIGEANWNNSGSANPATGVGGASISTLSGFVYPAMTAAVEDSGWTLNTGGQAFSGSVPATFNPWG